MPHNYIHRQVSSPVLQNYHTKQVYINIDGKSGIHVCLDKEDIRKTHKEILIKTTVFLYLLSNCSFIILLLIAFNQSIGVPSLRRGWRPWCAIRFCQVPSHCIVPYSFLSSRSRCHSNSFFFVLCLFFHPPCPQTLIFVGNDAFLHVHNRPVSFS